MKNLTTTLFLFILTSMLGQIPAGYYDNAQGLTGYALKTALKSIITNGHNAHSYDDLYNGYVTTDTDHYYENDGTVLDMYSENPNGPDPYNYNHNQNRCGNYSSEGDCYNREHLMPQSWFGSAMPMKADIHHVVPTDGKVNGMRGHLPLADVANASWTSLNGSKRGLCADQGYSGTVFEPIDEFKGDIARIYFYMATRYENEIGSWQDANDGSQAVFDGTNDHVFQDWYLNVLIQWHNQDPVSQREIDRNNAAYDYQGNRNPFIDHPEWVAAIWNPTPDTQAPNAPADLVAQSVSDVSVSLFWSAATDNVGVIGYEIYQNGNLIGTSQTTTYTVTNLSPNTTYQFCVKAKDAAGNISTCSNTVTVTTIDVLVYLIDENFDACPTMQFMTVSEASDKDWTCINQFGEGNSPAIQINGYQEDTPSKDWLITNQKINFDNYTNEKLSFFVADAYGSTPLELVYSTDYDGGTSPSSFTWTAVPNVVIPAPHGTSSTVETLITDQDISTIIGEVYIAFKYFSNGSPTRWTVDSFKISANDISGMNEVLLQNIGIYPNPVGSAKLLHIIMPREMMLHKIAVFDMAGKKILDKQFLNNGKSLNLEIIPSGLYLLKIQTNKGFVYKKLLIK